MFQKKSEEKIVQQKIEWLENCHELKYLWTLEEMISYLEEYEDRFRVVSKDNY